ncbi:odorant receptor 67d-like [Bactrocera tryoni]|uniref:odorant receptor 67d-like n=1 Tax=Bactrocera tryoni TaxID=59916 RepID=UPI001A96389A|nr:odorant receptor 67d-like [Bactrocera tryoni]
MQTKTRPSDNFCKLLKIIRLSSSLVGIDVIDENFKFNYVVGFVLVAIAWNFTISIYTVWKDVKTDWTVLLDVFSPISCATQGVIKIMSILLYPKLYRELAMDLVNIYKKYEALGTKYETKLFEWNQSMKNILIIGGLVYFVSAVLALITPVFLYIFKGERHLIIMCQMPYVDLDTDHGYFITIGYNILCVFVAAFGLYGADLYVFLFLSHSIFFYDIFALKVEDLHEVLHENKQDTRLKAMVNDIASWHQYYLDFNDKCNQIFFWTITAHILCTILGILTTLLIIMLKYWPGAYPYIFVCFVWLYMYSILGTRVEICNDQFCDGIYDINWYDLDVSDQKTVSLMLMQSQVPRIITIAGIEPLSVNTALKITRSIYSLAMMVMQFNE